MYLIFIEEHSELLDADSEVGLIELIGDIPSEGSKVPPLLNQRMEETETKKKTLPLVLGGGGGGERKIINIKIISLLLLVISSDSLVFCSR